MHDMRYSRKGYWGASIAGAALAIGGVLAALYAMPPGVYWTKFLVLTVVILAGTWLALLSYRSADEVMLGTHKTAWFWGSMITLSFLGPLIIGVAWRLVPMPLPLLALSKLPLLQGLPHPQGMPIPSTSQLCFIDGAVFVIFVQLVAFLAVLAYLHLRPGKQ
jgi:hypothetical protein